MIPKIDRRTFFRTIGSVGGMIDGPDVLPAVPVIQFKTWIKTYRGSGIELLRNEKFIAFVRFCFGGLVLDQHSKEEFHTHLSDSIKNAESVEISTTRERFVLLCVSASDMNAISTFIWIDIGRELDRREPTMVISFIDCLRSQHELWIVSSKHLHPKLRTRDYDIPRNLSRNLRHWFRLEQGRHGEIKYYNWLSLDGNSKRILTRGVIGSGPSHGGPRLASVALPIVKRDN